MRKLFLAWGMLCASLSFAAPVQQITLSSDLSQEQINLDSKTFYKEVESYLYNDTCYRNEPYESYECYDYHDSELGKWVERCETTIKIKEVSYICPKVGYKTHVIDDGGTSEANIQLNVSNSEILEQEIGMSAYIDQSEYGLGRKFEYSFDLGSDSKVFIRQLESTKIESKEDGKFLMQGNLDLEIIDRSIITSQVNAKKEFTEATMEGFKLVIDGEIKQPKLYALTMDLRKKGFFSYSSVNSGTIELDNFKLEYKDGKTIVLIEQSRFPNFTNKKSGKYRLKTKLKFKDDSIVAPKYYSETSADDSIKFKISFKKNKIDIL